MNNGLSNYELYKTKFICSLLLLILKGDNNEQNNLNLSITYIQAQNMR